jgi:hypothetical protein
MMMGPLWSIVSTAVFALTPHNAGCAIDCRAGSFRRPVLYMEWRNMSREGCCQLCAANSSCAFSLHRAADGMCWQSPPTASQWSAHPGITACRKVGGPAWPGPGGQSGGGQPPLALWPAPRGTVSIGGAGDANTVLAAFTHNFRVRCSGACPTPAALGWYEERIQASIRVHSLFGGGAAWPSGSRQCLVSDVAVLVTGGTRLLLRPSMNESYTVRCNTSSSSSSNSNCSCVVAAPETVGAIRGLETLAQLAHASGTTLPIPLTVIDSPRFPYRGLLIDSARHFLPVSTIKRTLDAMSLAKLNVLHWHLTDDTAFPVQSLLYPSLSAKGAYHPRLVYTQKDLADIVRHASDRGVRVIPEFVRVQTRVSGFVVLITAGRDCRGPAWG